MAFDNNFSLSGSVGQDPELRFLPDGTAVASFSIAHTPRKKEGDKYVDGATNWFRCTAWRDMAENVAASVTKGMRVIVTGSVNIREWEDNDGNKRTSVEVQVDDLGPSLKWATAEVQRTIREKGEGAGNHSSVGGSGGKPEPIYSDSEDPFLRDATPWDL